MYWLVLLAVMFLQNKLTSSRHSSNIGCDSNLGCLLLPPDHESSKAREIDVSRKINTWHPVPKWKVFADANRNRTSFSSPYFKQDFEREDIDNFPRDNFSGNGDRNSRVELSERLNIKFFPLKDGNITIKSYIGKINETSTKQIALFVVYSHERHIEFSGTRNGSESIEFERKKENGKENLLIECIESSGCGENATVFVKPTNQNDSRSQSDFSEEVITIPIINNMTIEMKIGEYDRNNYTVMIIPVQGNFTALNDNVTGNDGDIIKIPLTQNMSLIMKSIENLEVNNTFFNSSQNNDINNTREEDKEFESTKNTEQLEGTQSNGTENNTESIELSTISYFSTINSEILKNKYNSYSNETLKIDSKENNRSSSETENSYNLNATAEKPSDKKKVRKLDETTESVTEQNEILSNVSNIHPFYNDTFRRSNEKLHKFEYSKKFGPFEVKQLNSSSQPFIATFQIVIKNKDKDTSIDYEEYSLTNKTTTSALHDSKIPSSKIWKNFERTKRNINKYVLLNTWKNSFQRDDGKQKFITSNNISNQNEHFNKYQKIPLNEAKRMLPVVGLMNNDSLISERENKIEQSNLSNLFSFSQEENSYLSPANSESNEKFNQNGTHKFKSKAFISNETAAGARSSGGTKSSRIESGDENKREVALPTLIQNKDWGENHPEKSELQIAEQGSVDKYWKMNTSSGQFSGSEDIKTEKICDLKDGCSKINDGFNIVTVDESEISEDRNTEVGEINLNKEEEKKKGKYEYIDYYKHNLMMQQSTQSVSKEDRFEETWKMNKMPYKRELLYVKDINDLKNDNHLINESSIIYSSKNRLNVSGYENTQKYFISKENGTSQRAEVHNFVKNLNTVQIPSDNWNESRKRFHEESRSAKQTRQFLPFLLKNLFFIPSTSNSLLRKKRSKVGLPFQSKDETVLYLMNFDDSLNGGFHNLIVNNYSFSNGNENKVGNKEIQKFLLNMFQTNPMIPGRLQGRNSNPVNVRNDPGQQDQIIQTSPQNRVREWLRRGSERSQNNGPVVQTHQRIFPNNGPIVQTNQRASPNKIMQNQNWIIVIPAIVDPSKQENVRNSAKPLFNNGKEIRINTQIPSEREREDDIFEDKEWIIVNRPTRKPTIKNPPNRKVNNTTTLPPKANKPRGIINKPPRKPKFEVTQEPWSPDMGWNFNHWTVSKNPWKTFTTTPIMMMMGGMGNGD